VEKDEARWNTTTVLSLMGVSSILAGTFVGYQPEGEKGRRGRVGERDYSNEGKFVEPKYASVKELQSVSLFHLFVDCVSKSVFDVERKGVLKRGLTFEY